MTSQSQETEARVQIVESTGADADDDISGIRFVDYVDESQLEHVMSLVGRDLSEPYSSTLYGMRSLLCSSDRCFIVPSHLNIFIRSCVVFPCP